MSPTVIWLIAGAAFIVIEIFGVPGIGFLFAGVGALIVGSAVEFGLLPPEDALVQVAAFLAISCVTAALLWKKLKIQRGPSYSNIVGTEAVVADGGLSGRKEGQVKWSGTLMRARLADSTTVDVVAAGSVVIVRQVEGNVLHVAPKSY